jgi:hypothetical protein
MASTRAFILAAWGLAGAVACNALLDNEPRYVVRREAAAGEAGEGGKGGGGGSDLGGQGGMSSLAGNSQVDAGAAGAPPPSSGGEGGAATCDCNLQHATSRCRDGVCEIAACQAGFVDANSMPGDGCETGDVPSAALLFWFMADRGLSYSGDQVSAWADQSSAHVTATATSAAAMPKRVVQASGPPMVEFDGADDGLKMPEGFATFTGTTFFAVAQAYPADGCAGIVSLSNGDDSDDIEYGRHTTGLLYYEVLGGTVDGTANAFEPNKRLLVSITQTNAGAVELRINGVLTGSPKTIGLPATVVRTQNFLGRDTYTECPQAYKGLLGEIVLYSRGVDAAEYRRIQTYLAAKWNIQVTAP